MWTESPSLPYMSPNLLDKTDFGSFPNIQPKELSHYFLIIQNFYSVRFVLGCIVFHVDCYSKKLTQTHTCNGSYEQLSNWTAVQPMKIVDKVLAVMSQFTTGLCGWDGEEGRR